MRKTGGWPRSYNIRAYWERRAETPETLAARFLRLTDRLRGIDPILALWTRGTYRAWIYETLCDRYAEEIAEGL